MKNLIALLFAVILFTSCESRSGRIRSDQAKIEQVSTTELISTLRKEFPECRVFVGDGINTFNVIHNDKLFAVTMQTTPLKVTRVVPKGEF